MPRYKMLVGKFGFQGKKYRAGDVFEAEPFQVVGLGARVQPLDKIEDYQLPQDDDIPRKKLQAVHRGFGKWDVVNNATEENINDHPLTKVEAKQLVEEIEAAELRKEEEARAVLEKEKQEKEEEDKAEEKPAKKAVVKKVEDAEDEKDAKTVDKKTTRSSSTVERKRRLPIGRGTKPEED
jgi:hypothetical protein